MFSIAPESSSSSSSHPPPTFSGTGVGSACVLGLVSLGDLVGYRSFPSFDKREGAHVLWVGLILAEIASSNDLEGVKGEDMVDKV